jgi:hypothetical protein
MQSKAGMSNVFTGVLVEENDPLNDAEWDALRQQLLDDEEGGLLTEEDDGFTPTPESSAFACLVYMAPGALIGILEASIFLVWLDASPTLGTAASIFSSMLWSFMTAFVSYICFRLSASVFKTACERRRIDHTIKYCVDEEEEEEDDEPTEYYFCVGVFIGFCTMCMAHDIIQGFPVGDILILTGLPAIAFASLMLFCASRQRRSAYRYQTPMLPKTRAVYIVD